MTTVIENAEKFLATASELAETKIEIAKLKATGAVSGALSSIAAIIVVVILATGTVTILSIGIAYYIGTRLGNVSYGFFILGAVYAVAGFLIYVNRKAWIQVPLKNKLIHKISGNDD